MKWLGTREVKVSAIVLPGDFAGRRKAAHVAELAKSIEAIGVIEPPVVEAGSMRLVAGGDRVAAAQAAGLKRIEVRLVEGSPRELERVRIEENLRRRHDDRDELICQLLLLDSEADDAEPSETTHTQRGETEQVVTKDAQGVRGKTERGKRREEVAKALGMTPAAVKQADHRAAKKKRPSEPEPAPAGGPPSKPPPPPAVDPLEALGFETRGVQLSHAMREELLGVCGALSVVDRALQEAQRVITLAQGTDLGQYVHQRLYQDLHRAADLSRRLRPVSVCTYCLAGHGMAACGGCKGRGSLTADELKAVTGRPASKANGASAKKLRIEMDDGTVVDPEAP